MSITTEVSTNPFSSPILLLDLESDKSAAAEKDAAEAAILEDKLAKDAVVIAREEASAQR